MIMIGYLDDLDRWVHVMVSLTSHSKRGILKVASLLFGMSTRRPTGDHVVAADTSTLPRV